ncbi:ribonuclease T [Psychromonas antarctica]|uniref:ribonuclease T n=1 Tax=Psychromonas antarctica TaxID=67573 RepID=UPI001EE8ED0B|nr:ribonuclease T [Psychromonas antarctica]MCG6202042.1 ribonuclease T [Psychromonas antarctica]
MENLLAARFRGYYPVVIDIETSGLNAQTDGILEIAAILPAMDEQGYLYCAEKIHFHVLPFEGANLDPKALAFTGIDPFNPLRGAIDERDALTEIFKLVRKHQKNNDCNRAILVAHNASFDQGFINQAALRCNLKRVPFHPFASFDTASMAGLTLGQTVLAKACAQAEIAYDSNEAHSALYDTEVTAQLFFYMVNKWKALGGWPPNT